MSESTEVLAEVKMEARQIEQLDAENHIVEGYASTFKPTRNKWIIPKSELVRALAGYLENPIVLLGHDQDKPIGKVLEAKIDDTGLWIKAKIDDEEVWQKIKQGLFRGFSVGGQGKVIEVDAELSHVIDFDLWEISVVSVPADRGAYIEIINYTPAVKNTPFSLSKEWDWDWSKDADAIIDKYGWEGLARACAYVEKEGNKLPEKKSAYKLPHHKLIDGKLTLVYGGVVAALRRLPQTDLPESDKKTVQNHLESHLNFLKQHIENNVNVNENSNEQNLNESDIMNVQNSVETHIGGDTNMQNINSANTSAETGVENINNNKEGTPMADVEAIKAEVLQEVTSQIEKEVASEINEVKQSITSFAEDLKSVKEFVAALNRETSNHGTELTRDVQADILRVVMANVAGRNVAPKYPATKRIVADYMETDDSKGGYLVLPEYEKVIDMKVVSNHPLLSKFPYQTVGSPKLIGFRMLNPTNPTDPVEKATYIPYAQRWTIESTTMPNVETPIFEQFQKDIRAMAGIFRISEMLLEDVGNFYDLVGSIMNILSLSINNTLDKEIVDYLVGLDATALGANLKTGTTLPTLDDLRTWTKDMLARGFGNLFWLMSDDVEQYYMTQKDANGLYLFGDAINGVENRIWNIPVVVDRHLPENSLYLISSTDTFNIKRLTGFRIDQNRMSYNEFVSGFILYRFIVRIDWDVAWNAGIMKFQKTV